MEVALLIALVVLLARGARFLGMMDARAQQAGAGVLDGLFALSREYSRSGELGWPHGVQEEDRDRVWTWAPPPEPADESDVIDVRADLIDAEIALVRVQRVR